MKESFAELVKVIEETFDKCIWTKEQTLDSIKDEPVKEAIELKEAIEKKDVENIKEEIGDLIYDALFIATIAEREGILTKKEILDKITEKIKRRKPWVFGDVNVNSVQEAIDMWNEIKKKEKEKRK